MRIFVPIKLRICTRCGHEECPCCNGFCDVFEDCRCSEDAKCIFDEPEDVEGLRRIDALRAAEPLLCCDVSVKDGLLFFTEDDEPTDEELEAMQ